MTTVVHPEHHAHVEAAPGVWEPARAIPDTSWWWRRKARKACKGRGGHWWHPDPRNWVGWFCCQCSAEAEGMPQDGS